MKNILFLLSLLLCFGFTTPSGVNIGVLVIEFENIAPEQGEVEITLFDSKRRFLKKNKAFQKKRTIVNGVTRIEIFNLPYGKYAIASYHDVNGNQKFDRSFMGFPKEPYAFSRKFDSKIRKPRFNEVAIQFDASHDKVKMEFMRY